MKPKPLYYYDRINYSVATLKRKSSKLVKYMRERVATLRHCPPTKKLVKGTRKPNSATATCHFLSSPFRKFLHIPKKKANRFLTLLVFTFLVSGVWLCLAQVSVLDPRFRYRGHARRHAATSTSLLNMLSFAFDDKPFPIETLTNPGQYVRPRGRHPMDHAPIA